MSNRSKKSTLSKILAQTYIIYGIFDFEKKSLVQVGLDLDEIIFAYELEGYDEDKFDVISFKVIVS